MRECIEIDWPAIQSFLWNAIQIIINRKWERVQKEREPRESESEETDWPAMQCSTFEMPNRDREWAKKKDLERGKGRESIETDWPMMQSSTLEMHLPVMDRRPCSACQIRVGSYVGLPDSTFSNPQMGRRWGSGMDWAEYFAERNGYGMVWCDISVWVLQFLIEVLHLADWPFLQARYYYGIMMISPKKWGFKIG